MSMSLASVSSSSLLLEMAGAALLDELRVLDDTVGDTVRERASWSYDYCVGRLGAHVR